MEQETLKCCPFCGITFDENVGLIKMFSDGAKCEGCKTTFTWGEGCDAAERWNRRPADPLDLLAGLKVPDGKHWDHALIGITDIPSPMWRAGFTNEHDEWELLGEGDTPRAAILAAVARQKEAGKPKPTIAELEHEVADAYMAIRGGELEEGHDRWDRLDAAVSALRASLPESRTP